MQNLVFLFAMTILALGLVGCDQDSDLIASQHSETTTGVSLSNVVTHDEKEKCGCRTIKATLTSVADFSTFTAIGVIRGNLKGHVSFTGDPNSVTPISSTIFPPLNPGTSSYTGQLEISTRKGMLTTRGVGIFEPGPFGVGTEFHRIVGGTGSFSEATGTLYFNLVANESGDQFTESVSGEICTPCEDKVDNEVGE